MQTPLLGKTLEEIFEALDFFSLPRYAASQIIDWIYKKRISDIQEMTNLSLQNRSLLAKHFYIGKTLPIDSIVSSDGTEKYLYHTEKGFVEAVFIPEDDRATLCISSQSGCRYGCVFCMTGKQGFQGNLTSGEIVNQLLSAPHYQRITNVVFMGMGEPLDNMDEVIKTCKIITEPWGLGWSSRRITISTVGIIDTLEKIINETNCHIAISLHTPFENERMELMPVQRKNPISEVISILKQHKWSDSRRVSFEYIMFRDFNDTSKHVAALTKLLNGLKCRVNLIRYHEIPGLTLLPSSDEKIVWFRDQLTSKGIFTTIRRSRGQDILAACGMLSAKNRLNFR